MQFLCSFYMVTKIIFIHRTINFYAISAPKTFPRILITDSTNLIVHHMLFSNFNFWEKWDRHSCLWWNLYVVERFYAVINLIFIHGAISMQHRHKIFLVILCIQSIITCHDSNFKFWRRRDRLHVLHLRSPCSMHCPMLILHLHSGKHDVGGGNYSCVR
jgi:hypothetical protein